MLDNPYYSQDAHGPWQIFKVGDFELESGGVLRDLELAYAVHGELNAARDNAILVPTWYSGTSKVMEQLFVGPGRALDPARYCIIIVNQIGNGISTSPHTIDGAQAMANFPRIQIGDDVRAQHKLVTEVFGIEKLALVFGGSMGAQQTYDWAVRYPAMVARAAPLAGYARNTDHDRLFVETLIEAITSDPHWNNGNYRSHLDVQAGLKRHARLWSVMGWSTEFFARECWRGFNFSSSADFHRDFMEPFFTPLDPNSLLCMARKWQDGDVTRMTGGDLAAALGRITAHTFVMPISTDMFFKVEDCAREQPLIRNSQLRVLNSVGGHLGLFGFEPEFLAALDDNLRELLALG
ncbi:MAG: alpha/beta fold hydrolase [Proteobacteria bacterium]|nr:alpha/beta fold hydrolase [Pseudomonadota bacterium]